MRILMVYCNTAQDNTVPIGVTQVMACLLKAGHEVGLFHTTFYKRGSKSSAELRMEALQYKPCKFIYESSDMHTDFRAKVKEFNPDIIGFSIFEVTFNLFKELIGVARDIIRSRKIKVAVGGIHAIFWPESIAGTPDVDFISIAEAENTFVDLCNKISSGKPYFDQPGFWIKEGKRWRKNSASELVDLNSLSIAEPFMFGDRFMMKPMLGKLRKTITVELSRGCPYSCTYCSDSFLARKFANLGKWYRVKSVSKIDEEYSLLINKYKPEFIYKFSETFLVAGDRWLTDYFDMYKKYSLPFWTESRPETINENNIRMLADSNCIRFSLGLESGNEWYRRRYLKRAYSNVQVVKATSILRKYGISFSMNLIIGFPFETRKMILDGIDILRKVKPDGISVYFFTPYKGCALRQVCEENDMIDKDFIGDDYFQMGYALRNNTLGEKITGLWRTIPLYVYLPKRRFSLIRKAEELTPAGYKAFRALKNEFYEKMRW